MANKRIVTDISEYRRLRRREARNRGVLMIVFALACLFGGYFFAISDFFAIRTIVVQGNTTVTEAEILSLCGVEEGDNVFSVNSSAAERLIRLSPYVDTAEVRRKPPGALLITVTERQSVAVMSVGTAMIELDGEGRVLRRYQVVTDGALPLISGVDYRGSGAVPGVHMNASGISEALTVLSALAADGGVGEVNVSDTQDIRLYTRSGIEVRLGDCQDLQTKGVLYTNIIANNSQEHDGIIDYVDVSMVSRPTVHFVD